MNIRPATEHDIPELLTLKPNHEEFIYRGRLKEMSRGESVFLVAEDDGHLVGMSLLCYYGKATYPQYPDIRDIYVHEGKRSAGIGSELIHICEELSRAKGFNTIGLAVNPTLNARARRLYERLGYMPTGDAPYLDGIYNGVEDWVVDMVKKI